MGNDLNTFLKNTNKINVDVVTFLMILHKKDVYQVLGQLPPNILEKSKRVHYLVIFCGPKSEESLQLT